MKQEIKTIANIIDGIKDKKYQFKVFEKKNTNIGGGEFKQNNAVLLNILKYTRKQIQKYREQMKAFQVLQKIQNNEVLTKYDSQDVKNKSLKGLIDCYILINSKVRKHTINSLYHEEAKYKSYWQKLTEYVCESRGQNSYEYFIRELKRGIQNLTNPTSNDTYEIRTNQQIKKILVPITKKIKIYKESVNNLKYLISETCYLNGYSIQNQIQSFHQKAEHSINYIGKQLGKYLGVHEQNSYNLNNINNFVYNIIKNQNKIDSDIYMMKMLSWNSFKKKFRDFNKDNKVYEIVSYTLSKINKQYGCQNILQHYQQALQVFEILSIYKKDHQPYKTQKQIVKQIINFIQSNQGNKYSDRIQNNFTKNKHQSVINDFQNEQMEELRQLLKSRQLQIKQKENNYQKLLQKLQNTNTNMPQSASFTQSTVSNFYDSKVVSQQNNYFQFIKREYKLQIEDGGIHNICNHVENIIMKYRQMRYSKFDVPQSPFIISQIQTTINKNVQYVKPIFKDRPLVKQIIGQIRYVNNIVYVIQLKDMQIVIYSNSTLTYKERKQQQVSTILITYKNSTEIFKYGNTELTPLYITDDKIKIGGSQMIIDPDQKTISFNNGFPYYKNQKQYSINRWLSQKDCEKSTQTIDRLQVYQIYFEEDSNQIQYIKQEKQPHQPNNKNTNTNYIQPQPTHHHTQNYELQLQINKICQYNQLQLKQLNTQLQQSITTLVQKSEEVNKLKSKIQLKEQDIHNINQQIQQCKRQHQSHISQNKQKVQQLEKILNQKQQRLQQAEIQLSQAQHKLQQAQNKKESEQAFMKENMMAIKQNNAELTTQIQACRKQIREMQLKYSHNQQKEQQLQTCKQQYQNKIQQYTHREQQYQQQLSSSHKTIKELTTALHCKEKELQSISKTQQQINEQLSQQIKDKQDKLSIFNDQLMKTQQTLGTRKEELKDMVHKKTQIIQFQLQKQQQLTTILQQLQHKQQQLSTISATIQEHSAKQRQMQELKQNIDDCHKQLEQLANAKQQKQRQVQQLCKEKQGKQKQIQCIQGTLTQKREQQQQQEGKLTQIVNQIHKYDQQLSQLQEVINRKHEENTQIDYKYQHIQSILTQKEREIQSKNTQLQSILSQLKRKSDQIHNINTQLNQVSTKRQQVHNQFDKYNSEVMKMEQQLRNKSIQLKRVSQELYEKGRQRQTTNMLREDSVRQLRDVQDQICTNKKKLQDILRNIKQPTKHNQIQEYLFVGDVLENAKQQKSYLISNFKRMGREVAKTKVIYMYPQLTQINFHQLIDGIPDYVVVVRLTNDMIIAAYSEQALVKGQTNRGEGFISSLTNREMFELRKNNPQHKVTLYDDYFILFGNSQIKIKVHENNIESNLGIVYRYFDSGTHKNPQVIFGTQQRQQTIKCYEVYQVQFK